MYSAAIVIAAIVHIQEFSLITAFQNGAPDLEITCSTLRPGHLPNRQPVTSSPYLFKVNRINDNEYKPGRNYTITLRGTRRARFFRGFLIQAKSTTDNSSVGTFWVKPSKTPKYQLLCMNNTAATHVNNKRKRKISLRWTAPSAGIGDIQFWYSIVEIHRLAENQSTYWAKIKSDVIHEFKECTITGQIKIDCALDERCANTCDNRNNSNQCPFPCVVRGCQCPEGKIVDKLTNECVEPTKCLPKCPIVGQTRKLCATSENCTRTCQNLKGTLEYCNGNCTRFGCECPNGTVVNDITKECVNPKYCPLNEGCQPECSHDTCRGKKRNVQCSIPNDSGFDVSCLDSCNTGFCIASYYSTDVQTPSQSCIKCDDPTDLNCLFEWSKCVKRADKKSNSFRKTQNPNDYKYYVHPCLPENS